MGEKGMPFISTISSPVQSFLVHFEITVLELLAPYELVKLREKRTKRREKQQLELDEIPQDQDQLKDQDLPQDLDPLQDLDSLQDLDLPQNGHLQPALDLIQEIKEDLDQNLIPQKTSQDRTRAKKPEKEKNFGMNEKLMELKTKWSNHIAWGKLYGCLSSDKNVLQLAWKDSQ